jgi:Gliding motility associated protein GldN
MKRSRERGSPSTGISPNLFLLSALVFIVCSCHSPIKESGPVGESFGKIIYDTYVINRDSTDSWGDECLAGFKREGMVDYLFNKVYKGEIIPTDYFTGEKIKLNQLKTMETEGQFSRKNISKIQFEEQWVWDNEKSELAKRILSMTIAYEVYDHAGKSRGQKPIFKLIFRKI